jgi:hypothetical protein
MVSIIGSNPAALLIKELVLSGKLTEYCVFFLSYYLCMQSEKLLTSSWDLWKENLIKTK